MQENSLMRVIKLLSLCIEPTSFSTKHHFYGLSIDSNQIWYSFLSFLVDIRFFFTFLCYDIFVSWFSHSLLSFSVFVIIQKCIFWQQPDFTLSLYNETIERNRTYDKQMTFSYSFVKLWNDYGSKIIPFILIRQHLTTVQWNEPYVTSNK